MNSRDAIVHLTQIRLDEITGETLRQLTSFAKARLLHMYQPESYADDMVQCAFERILLGMETAQGRKPGSDNVADADSFQNYVRGIISSIIEAMSRKETVKPLEEVEFQLRSADAPGRNAEISDLQCELFLRLRDRAPRRLLPTIDKWETVFPYSDRIPASGHRRYVGEVQRLAQEIMQELGDQMS